MNTYRKVAVYRGWNIYVPIFYDESFGDKAYKATLCGMVLYARTRVGIEREIDTAEVNCR